MLFSKCKIILIKENLTERSFSSVISLPIEKLKPFANHPYKVIDNEDMQSLVESIKSQGYLSKTSYLLLGGFMI